MPVHFIDNYAKNNLEKLIVSSEGRTLFGELWVYQQFLKFQENNYLDEHEHWYLKHNYNLSTHPGSEAKIEGQIDFLLLNKNGILLIEVKGGAIEVDNNDVYYSISKDGRYVSQNPFVQVKEYLHTIRKLLATPNLFIYRAVIFPHEKNFKLIGPQLTGYKELFFSKGDYERFDTEYAQNQAFFRFINNLGKVARRVIIKSLNPGIDGDKIEQVIYQKFPQLSGKEIRSLKSELFPTQTTHGYDHERIFTEIIQNENYEVLKGLKRNRKLLIEGGPGTGKTVLATKYIADRLLKQQRGIFFCANLLLKAKIENQIIKEYGISSQYIKFLVFHENINFESINEDLDFLVFDEAQEYFNKGLFDLVHDFDKKSGASRFMILYDVDQTILNDAYDLEWYADFFQEEGFSHYKFDTNFRCYRNPVLNLIAELSLKSNNEKIKQELKEDFIEVNNEIDKIKVVNETLNAFKQNIKESIFLVFNSLVDDFQKILRGYFPWDIEELTKDNIGIYSGKIRYTTPIKYRGLEASNVCLITKDLSASNRVQNYLAITRATTKLKIVLWSI